MTKRSNSLRYPPSDAFSWRSDVQSRAPENDRSVAAPKNPALPATPSADIKPLLERLLQGFASSVNASAATIRMDAANGKAAQLRSSVGLPQEFLEAVNAACLNCERKEIAVDGIYSADLTHCKTRSDCAYAGSQIQTLVTARIESSTGGEDFSGKLMLFFEQPQSSVEPISDTVLVFTKMLGEVIKHNKSIREAKRAELIAERQAIANEIHDSLAQSLAYTRMRTSMLLESVRTHNEPMVAKYAADIDEALESSQKTVRELITEFRCAMDPAGLLHALRTLVEDFQNRSDIALEYVNRVDHLELPLEYELQVSHIVKEALANIASHSGANHARLAVDLKGNIYAFTIEDDGGGGCTFTPIEGHYGMKIMRERAQRIGGEIKVTSSDGSGTRVQLLFPEPKPDWREKNE